MKQRLGVMIEDLGLAILRLSDRLRGTDHGPLPAWSYEVPPLTEWGSTITIGDYAHAGNTVNVHVVRERDAEPFLYPGDFEA